MTHSIEPKNLSAELLFEARGNPPDAHPQSAVGNFFPGLEFNFLNVWKRIFIGLELLESRGEVIGVDAVQGQVQVMGLIDPTTGEVGPIGGDPDSLLHGLVGNLLLFMDVTLQNGVIVDVGTPLLTDVTGPPAMNDSLTQVFLEWGNALAELHHSKGGTGEPVLCIFQEATGNSDTPILLKLVSVRVRRLLDQDMALISKEALKPGELTESLCSPWQTDFIGCACYYWAANRPDYVNTWDHADGRHGGGHNWLNQGREQKPAAGTGEQKPFYTLQEQKLLTHEDIMQGWEQKFRFVIGGKDEDLS